MADNNEEVAWFVGIAVVLGLVGWVLDLFYRMMVAVFEFVEWVTMGLLELLLYGAGIAATVALLVAAGRGIGTSISAWKQERRAQNRRRGSIASSLFPDFDSIEDRSTLDFLGWQMMQATAEAHASSWVRRLWGRLVSVEVLRTDQVEFERWRQSHLWEVVESPDNRSRLSRLYIELRSIVLMELQRQVPSPLTTEVAAKFAAEVLHRRTVPDQASFFRFVSDGHRFRTFLHQYGFEILSEVVRQGAVVLVAPVRVKTVPAVRRLASRPATQIAGATIATKRLPAVSSSGQRADRLREQEERREREERRRRQLREQRLQAEAARLRREHEEQVLREARGRAEAQSAVLERRAELEGRYLRGREPVHLFHDVQAGQCWLLEDMEVVLRQGSEGGTVEDLGREEFLAFWSRSGLEVLERHDERVCAEGLRRQEHRTLDDLTQEAVAVFRLEQERARSGEPLPVHPRLGFLLDVAGARIAHEVVGSSQRPEQYVERLVGELLREPDGVDRYCGEEVELALRDCERFRDPESGSLVYEELVRAEGLTPQTARSTLIQRFVAKRSQWRSVYWRQALREIRDRCFRWQEIAESEMRHRGDRREVVLLRMEERIRTALMEVSEAEPQDDAVRPKARTQQGDRLLSLAELEERLAVSRTTLHRIRKSPDHGLPEPVYVMSTPKWRESEIEEWIATRPRSVAGYDELPALA